MSDLLETKPAEGGEATKPETKPAEGGEATKPADWRTLLAQEDLKKNEHVLKAKSLDDVVNGFIKSSNSTNVKPINKATAEFKDYIEASEKLFDVKEDEYDKDLGEDFKKLAFEYRIPAPVAKDLFTKIAAQTKSKQEETETELIDTYKKQLTEKTDSKVINARFKAGLKVLDMTLEQYKEAFPGASGFKPALVNAIATVGYKTLTNKEQTILDEKDTDIPSDPTILKNQIAQLAAERLNLKISGQDVRTVDKELKAVKMKYEKSINKALTEENAIF